jgi:drug/metabolite transporter (DMT)-like permease
MHVAQFAVRFGQDRVRSIPAGYLAVLALVGMAALWGMSFVAAKAVLTEIPPVTLAFLRFAIAALVLVLLVIHGGNRPHLGGRSALLGSIGMTLFFFFQNTGLQAAGAAEATIVLGGGLPAVTALLGVFVLRERPDRWRTGGLCCSLLGVGAVALASDGERAESSLTGLGLLGLAAVCGAVFAILGRRAFAGPDLLPILAGSSVYGALFLLPPTAVEMRLVGMTMPSAGGVALLLYLGIGCSALAFVLWAHGLRHLTVTQNAILGNLEIPIGLAAAAMLLGETPDRGRLLGAVLVVAGAMLAAVRSGSDRGRSDDRTGADDHHPFRSLPRGEPGVSTV